MRRTIPANPVPFTWVEALALSTLIFLFVAIFACVECCKARQQADFWREFALTNTVYHGSYPQ